MKKTQSTLISLAVILVVSGLMKSTIALDHDVVVSVYQGPCRDGDFDTNLKRAYEVIDLAIERGSDFLALPETFLSGYDNPENMRKGARDMNDPAIREFISRSASHSMVIMAGIARKTDRGIYNSVLVIHSGELLGIYDKTMLTGGDRDNHNFIAGDDIPVFEANGARFAVVICHDTSFPHPSLIARMRGAELLFTPHYNMIDPQRVDDHRRWVRNCHIGLACQLKMVVARSNVVVTDISGKVGYGDSFILSPQGEPLAETRLFRTELITAVISPEMFKVPFVWADLEDIPGWMKKMIAESFSD